MAEQISYSVDGLSISVSEASSLTPDEWRDLQFLHRTSLEAIPGVDAERATTIVGWHNPVNYRETRTNPHLLVESGEWNPAVFDKILVCGLFDYDTPVSVTISHDTATPPLMKVKLRMPPRLPLPKVGARRYAHLRELYSHPDLDADLALVGLWHALAERHPNQFMSTYLTMADPADTELVDMSRKLSLVETGVQTKQFAGYESNRLACVQERVSVLMDRIIRRPGLTPAINLIRPYAH